MSCFALAMQNSGGKIEVGQYIKLLEQQDFSSVQETVEYNVVAQDSIAQHKTINFIAYRYKPLTISLSLISYRISMADSLYLAPFEVGWQS
jgi:hypothetical protein